MGSFLKIIRNIVLLAGVALMTGSIASAQIIPKAELKKLIETASTAQDHERLAKHFDAEAAQYEADAKDHEELAAEYMAAGNAHAGKHQLSGLTAEHCKYFAAEARRAAAEARKIAANHRQMAKSAAAK